MLCLNAKILLPWRAGSVEQASLWLFPDLDLRAPAVTRRRICIPQPVVLLLTIIASKIFHGENGQPLKLVVQILWSFCPWRWSKNWTRCGPSNLLSARLALLWARWDPAVPSSWLYAVSALPDKHGCFCLSPEHLGIKVVSRHPKMASKSE